MGTIPDTERRTRYTVVTASTGPHNVSFDITADGSDFAQWIEVFDDGVKLTAVTDFTVDSPTGSLGTIARPITDARITFVTARAGVIDIVGARRPRRTTAFTSGAAVTADDLNLAFNDLMAISREAWDLRARTLRGPPGETIGLLPGLVARQAGGFGSILSFDSVTGDPELIAIGTPGTGNVLGPAGVVDGKIAIFDGSGALLRAGVLATTIGEALTENRTYYIRSDATGAGDGLADTALGAMQTSALALTASSRVNPNGYIITYKFNDATRTVPILVSEGLLQYGGIYVFEGNTTTPANCVVSIASASNACIDVRSNPGSVTVKGFKVTSSNSGTLGLYAAFRAKVNYESMDWGALTGAGSAHVSAISGATIIAGNETISGGAGTHLYVDDSSYLSYANITATLTGTPAFSQRFAYAHGPGTLHSGNVTFLGTGATGSRYSVDLGGLIDTSGGGENFFPGNSAGTRASEGVYDGVTSVRSVAEGGTSVSAFTVNGLLFGNGGSPVQVTAAAANSILATNGSNVPALTGTLPTAVQNNITLLGTIAEALQVTTTDALGQLRLSYDGTSALYFAQSSASGNFAIVLTANANLVLGQNSASRFHINTGLFAEGLSNTGTGRVNAIGFDVSGTAFGASHLSGIAAGVATFIGAPSSANLLAAVTDETGTGPLVFANACTLGNPNIVGTATNDSAAAGSVGELITGTRAGGGSALALTTNTGAAVTSVSLTAGDWEVSAALNFNGNVATTVTVFGGEISTTINAVNGTNGTSASQYLAGGTAFNNNFGFVGLPMPTTRISLAATTTVYLNAYATFATNSAAAYGVLRARRLR